MNFLDPKSPRFDFVHFTCAKCGHAQVMTVRIGQKRCACIECKFPHAVRAEERKDRP